MDDLAYRYLGLALRLERHTHGYVEAYAGPAELREAISGESPAPTAELHDEALRIREDASALSALSSASDRARWLSAQATAFSGVARLAGGEEIALPDLVESLCDLPAEREPEPTLQAAHRLLDAALPPGPSLRSRLGAHRAANAIPADQVVPAAERMTAVLRDRARADLELPDGETLTIEPVHAPGSWHVHAIPEAGMRTRLQLNLGAAWGSDELLRAIGGEGYPGRHLARVVREANADGCEEGLVWCNPAPEATIGHGLSFVGRETLLGDFELAAELRGIARELGLSWDVERDLEVGRARERLAAAIANAALLLHHDALPEPEVRAYLAETALLEPDALERVMAGLAHPVRRVAPFAMAFAPRLVRSWLTVTGQTDGLARLLADQLTPGQLREEAGVAA